MKTTAILGAAAILTIPLTGTAHAGPGDKYIAVVASVKDQRFSWGWGTDQAGAKAWAMDNCLKKGDPDCTFVIVGGPCAGAAMWNGQLYGAVGPTAAAAQNAAIAQSGSSSAEYAGHCATEPDVNFVS
jgi:hypothetical protein